MEGPFLKELSLLGEAPIVQLVPSLTRLDLIKKEKKCCYLYGTEAIESSLVKLETSRTIGTSPNSECSQVWAVVVAHLAVKSW